jgi:phosphocarrier protein HPr
VQTNSELGIADAEVTLPDQVDLHARPAANFVRTAMRFSSSVSLTVGERQVDAKSLLSVLALGARGGTRLGLRALGDDAPEAIEALVTTVRELRE